MMKINSVSTLATILYLATSLALLHRVHSFLLSPNTRGLFLVAPQCPTEYSRFDSAIGFFGKKNNADGGGDLADAPTIINGKAVKAKVGEKLSVVAKKAGVPITYSCRKGDCGTCEIMMNGLIVKACQEKNPPGKCVIKTF